MAVQPTPYNVPRTDKSRQRKGVRTPSNTFPLGPIAGDLFFELDTKILWIWNGTAWKSIFNAT